MIKEEKSMAREVDLGSIVGPQGPQGEVGPQGPEGPAGPRILAPSTEGIPLLLGVQLRFPELSTAGE